MMFRLFLTAGVLLLVGVIAIGITVDSDDERLFEYSKKYTIGAGIFAVLSVIGLIWSL